MGQENRSLGESETACERGMNQSHCLGPLLGLHMTNVTGLGAATLMRSLLPFIEEQALKQFNVMHLHLPRRGTMLAAYEPIDSRTTATRVRRWLPNALSRLFECTVLGWRCRGAGTLIVFGDLPIFFVSRQVLFVHTAHVTKSSRTVGWSDRVKYAISRMVFRLNQRFVSAVIVQTNVMADRLRETYPALSGRISIVPQPPPSWLLCGMVQGQRTGRAREGGIQLIYPSAGYPHKNHELVYRGMSGPGWVGLEDVVLTIEQPSVHKFRLAPGLKFVGQLSPKELLAYYSTVDALLFPSLEESYGLPLVEAMHVGIPVLCADLPYARALCGDVAIYFSPHDPDGMREAFHELRSRLKQGWWPDWQPQLQFLPRGWSEVASRILDITQQATSKA